MFVMFTECNKLGMLMVDAVKSCLLCYTESNKLGMLMVDAVKSCLLCSQNVTS